MDNSSAFPIEVKNKDGYGAEFSMVEQGLSKREWFATHAPECHGLWKPCKKDDVFGTKARCLWRYYYADAMLSAGKEQ